MTEMQPPKGTRDFLPDEMEERRYVFDTIMSVYSRFGFREMETPAFENLDVLIKKSGEAIKDEIYIFEDKAGRQLGLRFDLTVPLARVVGTNPSLQKPFKRFCVSRVWRYDNPQAGRFREFWQADVDIIGVKSVNADIECIAAASAALKELGLKNFTIRVNNRKMVQGFFESIGIENIDDAFRIIDKLDKIGIDGVAAELRNKNFTESQIGYIRGFVESKSPSVDNELYKEGLKEIEDFETAATQYGISDISFDKSLVRGLGYYTGLVFEIALPGAAGSVGGGGRYDNLIGLYGQDQPAVGISIGVDRVIEVMREMSLLKNVRPGLVYVVSVKDDVRPDVVKLVNELRDNGVSADYDIADRKLGKQMEYANSIGARYVIVIGPQEVEKNTVNLKNMQTGEEKSVPRQLLFSMLKA